ncbi:MAG: GxxExxY protein [Planctomycetaceae bacterium]
MPESRQLVHAELTDLIIGAAMTVSNELLPGLNENLYENALNLELQDREIHVETQQQFTVKYKGPIIGRMIPDLIVGQKVLVDTKVVDAFSESHVKQVYGYLTITGLEVGLLINFKHAKLQWKRLIRTPGYTKPALQSLDSP